jgi:hypothetical protein
MPDTVASLYEQLFPLTTVMKQRVVETFSGDALNTDRWNISNSNAGYTIAMDDAVDGGMKLINNASHTHAAVLDFDNKHQFSATASEFIYVGKTATSSGGTLVGLAKDYRQDNAYDSAVIQHDAGYSNVIQTLSSDGTSQTVTSTGYTADSNYHVYKLECTSTALIPTIDGVIRTSKTTNRPVDPLMPVVKAYSYSGNTTQLNINYYEAYNT